jgi:hypothetical protein
VSRCAHTTTRCIAEAAASAWTLMSKAFWDTAVTSPSLTEKGTSMRLMPAKNQAMVPTNSSFFTPIASR